MNESRNCQRLTWYLFQKGVKAGELHEKARFRYTRRRKLVMLGAWLPDSRDEA